ncbi:hypothetical protein AZE42_13943, partial [Rhizopogon vesiculosus]
MKADHINLLWHHWERRMDEKKKLVVFIKAKTSDMRISGGGKKDKATLKKKKSAYVEVDSDEELASLAAASSGIAPSADHNALSPDENFLELVDAVKDLAKLSENLPTSKQSLNLPSWVDWSWDGSYLPQDVH